VSEEKKERKHKRVKDVEKRLLNISKEKEKTIEAEIAR
jgi:hypothetical protein